MIKELLQKGFALKNKGHYKHAIEVLYKALELDNTSSELLLEIADLYYRIHNEEKALNYIEQILHNSPQHIGALKLLEQIFINKGAFAEAEQAAKNIYCISNCTEDLVQVFKYLNQQGKYNEIFEYDIKYPNSEIYVEQAKAYFFAKNFSKAREILEYAREQDKNNQNILLLLGQVYYALCENELSIEIASQLEVQEYNAELLNFLGLIEELKNNNTLACDYLKKAVKLDSNNNKYAYNLANIYFKNGDYVYAKKYYNSAIALSPENPAYHFALANLYYQQKKYKKALEELPDNHFEASLLKITILHDMGFLALAKQELNCLLEKYPENPTLVQYYEKISKELGL